MLEICRVDAKVLSSEHSSLLVGTKDFSELKEGQSVVLVVAEVKMSCNLQSISLEAAVIRCSRKEKVLRSSSN